MFLVGHNLGLRGIPKASEGEVVVAWVAFIVDEDVGKLSRDEYQERISLL